MLGDELDESTWTYLNEFLLEYYDFFAYLEMTHPEINDIEDDDEFMEFVLSFTPKVLNENVGDIETITIPRAHYYAEVQDKLTIRSQAQAYEYVDDWWEPSQWFFLKYDGNNSVIDAKNSRSRIIGSDFNTSFSNFIFSNFNDYHSYFLIDENGPYANSKASVTSCTFINCTFVNCTRLFAYDNLQFINCHFIDCFTFYDPSMYENNNDIKTFYSSFCDLCIIVCGNNNRIVGCDFQISNGSFPIIYLKENTTISNNTFISSTPYAILLDSDKLNVDLKDNYIVSNINSSSIFLKIINSTDKVLTYSTNGTKLFGNDAIYIFDDTKVGSFSLGQYILEYNNNMNYPYKTNITTSLEDYNLVFTLNTTDNGNITLDDGTVIKVTGGKGSTPIAAAPGDTIQGTITGYLGEKYYALSSDYSLTVPKLSPNLNITTDELEFEYNQTAEIAIELESQTTKEANISIYDKDGKLVDSKLTKTTVTFTDLAAGTYTLNVTYPGDDTYLNESVTDTLTITQATPELTLDVVNTTATLEISITTNIDDDIIINVGGDEYKLNKDNTTFTLTNQAEGKYYVTATYSGNENYTSVSKNKTVTLSRADSNLEVSASVENNIVTITSTLNPTTGTITYIVNNKQYTKSVGEELIIDDLTPGNYTVFASYAGDLVYNPSNDNETFEIVEKTKADPKLELTVEDTLIKVSLNESATGDVIITIGDISF
ncbi:MAG: hypothetical protein IJ104_10950, partial [Methanobrevibacter sp.]|nr:hypothetical protein [Methanobrevibacter sp.]